jgi:hypothetical protein
MLDRETLEAESRDYCARWQVAESRIRELEAALEGARVALVQSGAFEDYPGLLDSIEATLASREDER